MKTDRDNSSPVVAEPGDQPVSCYPPFRREKRGFTLFVAPCSLSLKAAERRRFELL